jgi:ribosomal protein S18 acetylase RimI-like enzyme
MDVRHRASVPSTAVDIATDDRTRALDHLERIARAVAQREVDAIGGVAVLDDRTPRLWDANNVIANASHDHEAQELADGCAVVSAEAGLGHRMVVIPEESEADRLRDGFDRLHWDLDRHLVMALRREADREPPAADVRRVRFPAVKGPRRAILLDEPWGGEDVAEQVLLRDRLIDERVDDQGFAAFVDRRPVAFCRLIAGDGIGQIEDVATLAGHQNRGLARAVIDAAIAASRAAGHDLTIVVADADDWPKELYARLGFDDLTLVHRWRIALAAASCARPT